ncbi:MAG: hypothetical protein FWG82_01190 [Oscillospiraceae bacterium]|nr:hypothetical protein [Oscillospiraceae bacterium]
MKNRPKKVFLYPIPLLLAAVVVVGFLFLLVIGQRSVMRSTLSSAVYTEIEQETSVIEPTTTTTASSADGNITKTKRVTTTAAQSTQEIKNMDRPLPVFEKLDTLFVGIGEHYEDNAAVTLKLNAAERERLWALLDVDSWELMEEESLDPHAFSIFAEQTWFFAYGDQKTLIVPFFPENDGRKICYFAPEELIANVLAFAHDLG